MWTDFIKKVNRMKLAKIKWDKSDDLKQDVLIVQPTLYSRLFKNSIPIIIDYKQNHKSLSTFSKKEKAT